MPIYLLNIHDSQAREDLIKLKDFSSLLQEGLLIEAENETKAREYALKHFNTINRLSDHLDSDELTLRKNYSNLWSDPNLSSAQEISSS